MAETLAKCSFRRIRCSYHIYDHIYIGYSDGFIVQMDLNGKILYAGKTNLGCIETIFHFKDKLIICGEVWSFWDITYPIIKIATSSECTFTRSATFDDTLIYSTNGFIISVDSLDVLSGTFNFHRVVHIEDQPIHLCINEDFIVFANFDGIFKMDHNLENQLPICERKLGDAITISDGKGKRNTKLGHIRSMCIWRDAIVTSSLIEINDEKTVRWKCGSMNIYEPELFLEIGPLFLKIMDDQLFESDISKGYTVNCWSWNKVHLRSFVFSGFDWRGIEHSLLINGNIYMFNDDTTICKRTGILVIIYV